MNRRLQRIIKSELIPQCRFEDLSLIDMYFPVTGGKLFRYTKQMMQEMAFVLRSYADILEPRVFRVYPNSVCNGMWKDYDYPVIAGNLPEIYWNGIDNMMPGDKIYLHEKDREETNIYYIERML